MKVFRNINELREFKNAVITIGSFDGIHHGHREIFLNMIQKAKECDGETVVITFHPHPRQIVYPKDHSLQLLSSIEEKIKILDSLGIDNLVIVPFTIEFSQQSADEYIFKFLYEKFHPRYIIIGHDHKFGLNRQGDVNYLKSHRQELGFEVIEITAQVKENIVISSTKIRTALSQGNIKLATELLQHHYTIRGTVGTGQNIGTKIGFPTANITVSERNKLIPKNGIYAVIVNLSLGRFGGMLYIGNRPTLNDGKHISIEVNIFDFNHSIYGEKIEVELIDWIRSDEKYESLEKLKLKLAEDRAAAHKVLKQQTDLSLSSLT